MNLILFDKKSGNEITDIGVIMRLAGMSEVNQYDSFGIQADGRPVVFDKSGKFGYLDASQVRMCIDL